LANKVNLKWPVFVRPAAKNFGIREQKQLKLAVFVLPCSEKFLNWRTKSTEIVGICSAAQRKILANNRTSN
jgi:hypothetical protein